MKKPISGKRHSFFVSFLAGFLITGQIGAVPFAYALRLSQEGQTQAAGLEQRLRAAGTEELVAGAELPWAGLRGNEIGKQSQVRDPKGELKGRLLFPSDQVRFESVWTERINQDDFPQWGPNQHSIPREQYQELLGTGRTLEQWRELLAGRGKTPVLLASNQQWDFLHVWGFILVREGGRFRVVRQKYATENYPLNGTFWVFVLGPRPRLSAVRFIDNQLISELAGPGISGGEPVSGAEMAPEIAHAISGIPIVLRGENVAGQIRPRPADRGVRPHEVTWTLDRAAAFSAVGRMKDGRFFQAILTAHVPVARFAQFLVEQGVEEALLTEGSTGAKQAIFGQAEEPALIAQADPGSTQFGGPERPSRAMLAGYEISTGAEELSPEVDALVGRMIADPKASGRILRLQGHKAGNAAAFLAFVDAVLRKGLDPKRIRVFKEAAGPQAEVLQKSVERVRALNQRAQAAKLFPLAQYYRGIQDYFRQGGQLPLDLTQAFPRNLDLMEEIYRQFSPSHQAAWRRSREEPLSENYNSIVSVGLKTRGIEQEWERTTLPTWILISLNQDWSWISRDLLIKRGFGPEYFRAVQGHFDFEGWGTEERNIQIARQWNALPVQEGELGLLWIGLFGSGHFGIEKGVASGVPLVLSREPWKALMAEDLLRAKRAEPGRIGEPFNPEEQALAQKLFVTMRIRNLVLETVSTDVEAEAVALMEKNPTEAAVEALRRLPPNLPAVAQKFFLLGWLRGQGWVPPELEALLPASLAGLNSSNWKEYFARSKAGVEEAAARERLDGMRSAAPQLHRVVISRGVAEGFPAIRVLAGLEQNVVIDEGPDTVVRLAEAGVESVAYYGGMEEIEQFAASARGILAVNGYSLAEEGNRAQLEKILLLIGLPPDAVSAGLEAVAAGLEAVDAAA